MVDHKIAIEQLGEINVYNEFEDSVRLADLWHERAAVLIFVRHFG